MLGTISGLLDQYHGSHRLCHHFAECDPLALGKLLRGLQRIGLYPIPESSKIHLSLQDLVSKITSIELSPFCKIKKIKGTLVYSDSNADKAHIHMDEEVRNSLYRIRDGLCGLELRQQGVQSFRENH